MRKVNVNQYSTYCTKLVENGLQRSTCPHSNSIQPFDELWYGHYTELAAPNKAVPDVIAKKLLCEAPEYFLANVAEYDYLGKPCPQINFYKVSKGKHTNWKNESSKKAKKMKDNDGLGYKVGYRTWGDWSMRVMSIAGKDTKLVQIVPRRPSRSRS